MSEGERLELPGGLPGWVQRLFGGWREPPVLPRRRVDHLDASLHLTAGVHTEQLFPPGPLDPLAFFQRHHASLAHELEFVTCLPGAGWEHDGFRPYAVLRLRERDAIPLVPLKQIEQELRLHYGALAWLPRARPLFHHQYSDDLDDEDPPGGLNRIRPPEREDKQAGRFSVQEMLDVIRRELPPIQVISWIEAAFRQRPGDGRAEHRYYLDATAQVWLVRDHPRSGKRLYRGLLSGQAPSPERR